MAQSSRAGYPEVTGLSSLGGTGGMNWLFFLRPLELVASCPDIHGYQKKKKNLNFASHFFQCAVS